MSTGMDRWKALDPWYFEIPGTKGKKVAKKRRRHATAKHHRTTAKAHAHRRSGKAHTATVRAARKRLR